MHGFERFGRGGDRREAGFTPAAGRGGVPPTGMWANLGARLTVLEPGTVEVEANLTPVAHGFLTTKGDIVHGGAIAALADMALASAGSSLAHDGEAVTTVDLKVDFMQPAEPGRMLARARVQRRTRRLCFAACSVEQADGDVVAEARALLTYVAR